MFTGERGAPLNPPRGLCWLRVIANDAGLLPIRLHDLRHCAATFALTAGTDIKVVQAMLGHKNQSNTADIYTSVLPEVAFEAAERTAALIPRSSNR
ncbi:hypothetical protein GCM10010470_03570 [Saccharopolyspora taberi]|uniref:Tyr recombinase domain-containing protein n=1 Tax=Saccharopolyspora taberi TaxID=60895 RepID=A0ABN3V1R7_9PSEU